MKVHTRKFILLVAVTAFAAGCNPENTTPTGGTGTCPSIAPRVVAGYTGRVLPVDPSESVTRLVSHIPREVAQFTDLGKKSESDSLSITLELTLNNESDLNDRIRQMYTPGSQGFHQFLSPQQFRERYAPTSDQVEDLRTQLANRGIYVSSVNDNGYLMVAQASVGDLNTAFKTEIHQYLDSQGHSYFAPAYELQVPSGMPIRAVHGLHNVTARKSFAVQLATSPTPGGSGPLGGFSPANIRTAYNVPTTVTGKGQTLALFELDGYAASDITAYQKEFSLTAVPLQNVLVDSATGAAGSGAAEVTLDIELMNAIAPGATKIMVYEGPNSDQGVVATYAKIANDNLAAEISTSWGSPEDQSTASVLQSENTIFTQMAAQGQTIFSAAGDSGAYDDGSSLTVDDPASQPYVTGVGGTQLTLTSAGAYGSETTWNGGSPTDGAGGGGISSVWSQPSWQNGVVSAASLGSTTMRNVPDVSLNADPDTGYSIYVGGAWNVYGGTSCAAPLWAAFAALVNQQRLAANLKQIGYITPLLYSIGTSTNYDTDFNDIKDGSTNLHYPAVTGYDDATGWGTYKAQGLFNDLIQDSLNLIVVPLPSPAPGC